MATIEKTFKPKYVQGETARFIVRDDSAVSVRLVFGEKKIAALKNEDGAWVATIATDSLVGLVRWSAFREDADGEVSIIDGGAILVTCAGASKLRAVIAAIDEAIKGWGTSPNKSIKVGEISIAYKSLDELLAVRAQYVQRAEAEETGRSTSGGLRIMEVRFE